VLPSDLDIGDVRRPHLVGEQDAPALLCFVNSA
jgi:hypothetical protein